MNVRVRTLKPGDEAAWREMWDRYLAFYDTSRPEEVFAQSWDWLMQGAHGMHGAIAEADGRAVGIVNFLYHHWFWARAPKVYLNDLYVDPAARGTGAGRAMIEYVERHAAENGAVSIYWLTAEDNAVARRLYDRIAQKSDFVHYTMTPGAPGG